MSSLNDVSGIPTEGKNLIIVAAVNTVNNVLHFRIFDGDGKVVVDTDEKRLTEQARQIEDLRKQLESLWPPHGLTRSDKGRVITAVTSIIGHIPRQQNGKPFSEVLGAEIEAIQQRRERFHRLKKPAVSPLRYTANSLSATGAGSASVQDAREPAGSGFGDGTLQPTDLVMMRRKALEIDLAGLAFSGGGIRSATLAVGFLQGLAQLGLLPQIDYLSTVSGGGYAGSWLAAWIKRDGDLKNVQHFLDPSRVEQARGDRVPDPALRVGASGVPARALPVQVIDEEPEPVYHLRAYSNYLTPRPGLFTTDTWTVFSIYFRNLLINLAIIVPAAMVVVLLMRLIVWIFSWSGAVFSWSGVGGWFAVTLDFFSLLAAVILFWDEQGKLRMSEQPGSEQREERGPRQVLLIVWLFIAVALTSVWLFSTETPGAELSRLPPPILSGLHGALVALPARYRLSLLFAVLLFVIFLVPTLYRTVRGRLRSLRDILRLGFSFLVMGALGGLLFQVVLETFVWQRGYLREPFALATLGPPLLLLVLALAGVAQTAVAGRALSKHQREWQSRHGALLLLHVLGWLALFGTTLYLPWVIEQSERSTSLTTGAVLAWLGSTVSGILFSRSSASPARAGSSTAVGGNAALRLIAALAPAIFLVGLLALTSVLVSGLPHIGKPEGTDFLVRAVPVSWCPETIWLGILALAVVVLLWFVNVNLFSLHEMYANRLMRCYLGASQTKRSWARRLRPDGSWGPGKGGAPIRSQSHARRENRFTGFDPNDDFPLHELRVDSKETSRRAGYTGPFPLINTALNLVAGDELAYQDRKAESFVLTPLYCGSTSTGYAELPSEEPRAELTLGRAMAISGAAADPNMGYNQSAAQTALMTIFNARLGWWLENPAFHENWAARSPSYGGLLIDELLGHTTAQSSFVHLSDGGHFDNLGIYELVRRRCRFVVACDFAEDRNDASENLANVIRLCRRDFGVRIEIDTSSLHKDDRGLSRAHVSIGTIHYDDVDVEAIPGMIVFIRSSLTGDEPPDVRNYAINNPAFPHHSTLDQFFNEAQFESYRALGNHMAYSVFSAAAAEVAGSELSSDTNERLFSELRHRWFPAPADLEKNVRDVAQWFLHLQDSIRRDPHLRDFSRDLYPELDLEGLEIVPPVDAFQRERAEIHAVSQILQTMQAAWRQVRLEGYPEHPMNRGWANVFRRCARTRAFHEYWPALRSSYNTEFVRFCEHELRLPTQKFEPVAVAREDPACRDQAFDRFDTEFKREWPAEYGGQGLAGLRDRALRIWLIREKGTETGTMAYGAILLFPIGEPGGSEYELLVWILPPYRNVGIGRSCLEEPLEEIWKDLRQRHPGRFQIVVRLPDVGLLGGADKPREDLWLHFFYHYGFRRREDRYPRTHSDLVMEKVNRPGDATAGH